MCPLCSDEAGCASILLQQGANVSPLNKRGGTPLHVAVNKNHVSCVRLISRQTGCDLDAQVEIHKLCTTQLTALISCMVHTLLMLKHHSCHHYLLWGILLVGESHENLFLNIVNQIASCCARPDQSGS